MEVVSENISCNKNVIIIKRITPQLYYSIYNYHFSLKGLEEVLDDSSLSVLLTCNGTYKEQQYYKISRTNRINTLSLDIMDT